MLDFAAEVSGRGIEMWVRYVLLPGITDSDHDCTALARFVLLHSSISVVDVLPYHELGKDKWAKLGLQYPLAHLKPYNMDDAQRFAAKLRSIIREGVVVQCN